MSKMIKIGKRIGISLMIGIVWLLLYSLILWKIPFYVHINRLALPAGSKNFVTKVTITDYASVSHVVAQKVFVVDLKEKEVAEYIEVKNEIDFEEGNTYRFYPFSETFGDFGLWRGCVIDPIRYANQIPDEDWENYYTVFYTSIHDDTVIENVFYVAIFSEAAILILSMVLLTICERKKEKGCIKEAEAVTKGDR